MLANKRQCGDIIFLKLPEITTLFSQTSEKVSEHHFEDSPNEQNVNYTQSIELIQ